MYKNKFSKKNLKTIAIAVGVAVCSFEGASGKPVWYLDVETREPVKSINIAYKSGSTKKWVKTDCLICKVDNHWWNVKGCHVNILRVNDIKPGDSAGILIQIGNKAPQEVVSLGDGGFDGTMSKGSTQWYPNGVKFHWGPSMDSLPHGDSKSGSSNSNSGNSSSPTVEVNGIKEVNASFSVLKIF